MTPIIFATENNNHNVEDEVSDVEIYSDLSSEEFFEAELDNTNDFSQVRKDFRKSYMIVCGIL